MKKWIKRLVIIVLLVALLGLCLVFVPSFYITQSQKNNIVSAGKAKEISPSCAIIFGAAVRDGKPSPMLRDRLLTGISLYEDGVVNKLLMSGDHGKTTYDEVNVMKTFAIEHGVPDEDIYMDHAGFSTYETIYRAKEVFEADSVVLVSQSYHLYRALYIAEKLDVTAKGVSADLAVYSGQSMRDLREILARDKDFVTCLFKPQPTYLGDKIPVNGNGNVTNDQKNDK